MSRFLIAPLLLLLFPVSANAQLFQPRIDSVPIERTPQQFLKQPNQRQPIDPRFLQRNSIKNYVLAEDDVLGVFIEGVLGNLDESPPVQMPAAGSNDSPSLGYPVPVRSDGTVSLPLVHPIQVAGLTVPQAEQLIARAYREGASPILRQTNRILVSLMRKRTNRVIVIRQDNPSPFQNNRQVNRRAVSTRTDQSARTEILQLTEEESDVLNALSQTGGLPGLNEKSDVRLHRGNSANRYGLGSNAQPGAAPFPRSSVHGGFHSQMTHNEFAQSQMGYGQNAYNNDGTLRVPTRVAPGQPLNFGKTDVQLKDGDVLYVDSRGTEVYYTGGLLRGGEFLLPRDQDLDVLEAVSIAGTSVGVNSNSVAGIFGPRSGLPPTELIVLRKTPGQGNGQIAIRVDLNGAINNPRSRMIVAPGDTLILRYKPQEQLGNVAIGILGTYGVRALLGR